MVKIFPARFIVDNESVVTHMWEWVNDKIKDSKVSQIVPLEMERSASKTSYMLKGLIEVHCRENITTSELSGILRPYPNFIQNIYLSFQ
ncbi:hypothetical protein [Anaeroselena agilis]|uniref:Uncharacterized protein n=1 Tax=Anaeroselena agilis TaxID=3063788 RepID=A0ABU3NYU0_9FIRM|nr:hypothetical protein [Selenomonadales bacterium 4137-cl]